MKDRKRMNGTISFGEKTEDCLPWAAAAQAALLLLASKALEFCLLLLVYPSFIFFSSP